MKVSSVNSFNNNSYQTAFSAKHKKKSEALNKDMLLGALTAMAVMNSCAPSQELYRNAGYVEQGKNINLTTSNSEKFDFNTIMAAMPSLYKAIGMLEEKDDAVSIVPMQIEYKNKNDIVVTYFPETSQGNGIYTPDGDAGRIDNLTQRTRKLYKDGSTYIKSIGEKEAKQKEKYIKEFAKLTGCTPDKVRKLVIADYLNNDRLNMLVEKRNGETLFFDLNNKKIEDWSEFNPDNLW